MRLSDNNANIKGGKVKTTGTAPSKVTSATIKANNGVIKLVLGLPNDPVFSSYTLYVLDNSSATQPAFPGGSPLLRDKTNKPEDDTCPIGVRRHVWVVTQDANNYPNAPVEANAFYCGSVVNLSNKSVKVS